MSDPPPIATAPRLPGQGDDPIVLLAESTARQIGNEFLSALVTNLHTVMSVSLAFITEGIGEPPTRARALFSWKDGDLGVPIEYELEGTPCQLTYQGQHVVVPCELKKKFPKESDRFESYCGVPLRDRVGRVCGNFAVFADEPVRDSARVEGIVRIFGMRVEAELQRLARDAEREKMLERLDRQHNAARQANQFKSQLLGMVAHDLRNPLAAVVSRAEFIQSVLEMDSASRWRALDAEASQKIANSVIAVHSATDRMEKMIADLLEASRKEAASISLRIAKISLCDPVRTAVRLSSDAASAKNIQISERCDDAIELIADEDRLIEALGNLLGNAIKYSPQGGTVTVTAKRLLQDDAASITVADKGLGMNERDLADAFQRFRTLSARPTGGEASTGLGLAIVKTIAEAHGGQVEARSEGKGKGSAFTLTLPLSGAPPGN